jgi:hypothetical protein
LKTDNLQLQCCGVTGPQDWADSKYNKAGKNLDVTSKLQMYRVPMSCCRAGIDETVCNGAVETGIGAQISNLIYSEVSDCGVAAGRVNPFTIFAGMYLQGC